MTDIAHKAIVLKLNAIWVPIDVGLVKDIICDLINGVVLSIDIQYPLNSDGSVDFNNYKYINPVGWDEWIKLPVRKWDFSLHSQRMHVRVPTVVITKNYKKVPTRIFKGKPTKQGLFIRDNGIDAYTGEEINYNEATIDHVIPRSKGGKDTYDNAVLTDKKINNKKANKSIKESGLKLWVDPKYPKPIKVSHTFTKSRHPDWSHFLIKNRKKYNKI